MRQKTYRFKSIDELHTVISEIINDDDYEKASSVLLQLYNPRVDLDDAAIVSFINLACPKAVLTGMTCANISEEKYDIRNEPVQLSVIYFFHTTLTKIEFDLYETSMFIAGRVVSENLEELDDTKCMQIFYATPNASISVLANEISHTNLPIFGAKAGRNIRVKNTAYVYGSKPYSNGIVIVLFHSTQLSIFMDNLLDWHEIGANMVMTKVEGDRLVSEIDSRPAIEIYEKYLNVKPNEYFIQNVCEFPFIINRNGKHIARVPLSIAEDGAITFNSDVLQGEQVRLSYALPNKLLNSTREELQSVSWLKPQAVFFFECGNRQRFLRDNYYEERQMFEDFFPDYSCTTGYSELFSIPDNELTDLNSALIIVGLTENPESKDLFKCCADEREASGASGDGGGEIPFVERILTFLESTSKELDALNKQLGKVAYQDQLTKVYNRWELERNLKKALALAQNGSKFALIFLDIDHFKKVNDTFGHDMGDMVLRSIVNAVKTFIKPNHVFGRWGGEEFLYLLPDVDEKEAVDFAEAIRKEIDDACFVTVRHVTVSIGVTMLRPEDSIDSFVKRADEGLYEAKETGRNKVVLK